MLAKMKYKIHNIILSAFIVRAKLIKCIFTSCIIIVWLSIILGIIFLVEVPLLG